jgi:hypothetical protein
LSKRNTIYNIFKAGKASELKIRKRVTTGKTAAPQPSWLVSAVEKNGKKAPFIRAFFAICGFYCMADKMSLYT